MSPHAPVTVELVGENLLAFLGEKAEAPASVEAAPSPSILQSAKRPLFAPAEPVEIKPASAKPAGSGSGKDAGPESWSVQPRAADNASSSSISISSKSTKDTESKDHESVSTGLVLYQAPAPNRRALWLAAAGIAIVLGGFTAYAYTTARKQQALTVASPGAESLAKISPLKLQLESRDRALVGIRWDPQSPAVGHASSGRLLILEDGAQTRIVPLDADQLKIGHLYYDSAADRVEFRLEVIDGNGAVTTESLLAVALPPSSKPDTTNAAAQNANPAKPAPVSRTIAPAVSHEADALRAVSFEPASQKTGTPAFSVLAALPPTFNHFAPPPSQASDMTPPSLLHRVAPVYPPNARAAHLAGTVLFSATIAKDGTVKNLQPVSGNSMLVEAAASAARQWLYRPALQSGHPVEAPTQIAVDFTLN